MTGRRAWVGPVHRLNYLACLKIPIQTYFNFFRFFLKVLQMFECRRSDLFIIIVNIKDSQIVKCV